MIIVICIIMIMIIMIKRFEDLQNCLNPESALVQSLLNTNPKCCIRRVARLKINV